jgi:hypothetical protein
MTACQLLEASRCYERFSTPDLTNSDQKLMTKKTHFSLPAQAAGLTQGKVGWFKRTDDALYVISNHILI